MRIPTADECSANAKIEDVDDYSKSRTLTAAWYPQMGGYVGRCWIYPHKNGCFDVYVWHDGEFPFDEGDGRNPARLHHCCADQFIEFGKLAESLAEPE